MSLTKKEFYVSDLVIDDEYGIIDSKASVQEASIKMREIGIPDLVVVEEDSNKVLGVIADFDIITDIVAEGLNPKEIKVVEVMYIITPVTLNTTVEDAFTRMRDLQVNVVPVMDNGKLLGVTTIQDCWSYIPDQIQDEIGLIPVKNTKVVEFWMASVFSILAFILIVILPMAGIYGFFRGNQQDLLSLFGLADLRGGEIIFSYFEARGVEFFIPLINLVERNGLIWVFVVINGLAVFTLGFLTMLSTIYTSFLDIKYYETNKILKMAIPILFVVFSLLEWILFSIGFALSPISSEIALDILGLIMTIISAIFILLAVFRDKIFRSKENLESNTNEENK